MPSDTKRLPVPEGTQAPQMHMKQKARTVITSTKRKDGRKSDSIRPIFFRVDVVSAAKGSAYLELNRTKVLCSVYGPRETTKRQDFSVNGKITCDVKFAPFSCPLRRQHQQDLEEKELSMVLKQALEPVVCLYKFPKSTIDIFILVLENDGSPLSAAITCAGAGLADAGIDMYDVIVGGSLKQVGDICLIDPTLEEENSTGPIDKEEGSLTIGWMPHLQQVAALLQDGNLQPSTVVKSIKILIESCEQTNAIVQNCLLTSLKKIIENEESTNEKGSTNDDS